MNQKLLKEICQEDVVVFSGVIHNPGEYEVCSTAEHLDDEIIDIVDAHLKELGQEPHHLMFSGLANKVQHAPGAYDEEENPLVIDSFYFHTYGFGEDK
jgi:hypothetical protein